MGGPRGRCHRVRGRALPGRWADGGEEAEGGEDDVAVLHLDGGRKRDVVDGCFSCLWLLLSPDCLSLCCRCELSNLALVLIALKGKI